MPGQSQVALCTYMGAAAQPSKLLAVWRVREHDMAASLRHRLSLLGMKMVDTSLVTSGLVLRRMVGWVVLEVAVIAALAVAMAACTSQQNQLLGYMDI